MVIRNLLGTLFITVVRGEQSLAYEYAERVISCRGSTSWHARMVENLLKREKCHSIKANQRAGIFGFTERG